MKKIAYGLEELGYFISHNYPNAVYDGHIASCQKKIILISELIRKYNIKSVLEIGFNAGHSSVVFIENNINTILSFDLGDHDIVAKSKEYIDKKYPNISHTLIIGNSAITVPRLNCPTKFDLIFIDGGHNYDIVEADIINCKKFAHKNTLVILDDTMYTEGWKHPYNIGPSKVWEESKTGGLINSINSVDIENGKGFSYGQYKCV
jgi:predicted O-methyltransferase YrrM